MAGPLNSSTLLLWTLDDVRGRALRFLAALKELRRTSSPGERAFLEVARQRMESVLLDYETELDTRLAGVVVERDEGPEKWGDLKRFITRLARKSFKDVSSTQRELFPFLPINRRVPGDIAFFVSRSFGLDPTDPLHQSLFTLSHGRFSSWEGKAFVRPDVRVATLPIPLTETLSPLRWPLLVHELAHWYLPGGEPIEARALAMLAEEFPDLDDAPAWLKGMFWEVLADRVAYRSHGFSYAAGLAVEAFLSDTTDLGAPSYQPGPLARLALLLQPDPYGLLAAIPVEWQLDSGYDPDGASLKRCADVADRLLEDFSPEPSDGAVVADARRLLEDDQAVSAVHQFSDPLEGRELEELMRLRSSGAAGKARSPGDPADEERLGLLKKRLSATAVDRPCKDREILEAAWLLELDVPSESLLEGLRSRRLDRDHVERSLVAEIARLAGRDTAITRSLQAAAVHRWLMEWDHKIRDEIAGIELVVAQSEDPKPPEGSGDDPAGSTPGTPVAPPAGTSAPADAGADVGEESSPLSDLQLIQRLARTDDRALVVRPIIDPSQIGGTTVDVRLGTEWEVLRTSRFQALDPGADPQDVEELMDASVEEYRLTAGDGQSLVLHPGELLLALTLEYFRLPDDLWGNLEGRSTWARLGLQVHATAGMVDCGFRGYLTLELQNTGRLPMVLSPGLRVGQMAFFPVSGILNPYHGRPSAAYSAQTSARTAFPRQHEHAALNRARKARRGGQ